MSNQLYPTHLLVWFVEGQVGAPVAHGPRVVAGGVHLVQQLLPPRPPVRRGEVSAGQLVQYSAGPPPAQVTALLNMARR